MMNELLKKNPIHLFKKGLQVLKNEGPVSLLKRVRNLVQGYDPDCLFVEYPENIQLSLNKTCNLKCTFCARQTKLIQDRLSEEKEIIMPVEFLENNLNLFRKAKYVNLAADGEPLMHPEIRRIFTILGNAIEKPNIVFVTNSILLNDKLIDLIIASQIMEIHFSIDSLNEANSNFIRPGFNLDKFISIIKKINDKKKQNKSEFPRLILRPTFISLNISELPSMVDFCHQYEFSAMIIQQMQIYKPELSRYSIVYCKDQVKENIDEAVKKGIQYKIALIFDPVFKDIENQTIVDVNNALAKIENPVTFEKDIRVNNLIDKCNLPWNFMLVQTNGDVFPCCHTTYKLGNLYEQTWEQIWNGDRSIEIRKKFMKNILPKECVNQPCGIAKIDT